MRYLRSQVCLFVLCLFFTAAVFAQDVATVAELEGSAEVVRDGATQPATVGMAIRLNDEIKTGRPGHLLLVFQDQSVTALADGSHLRIDEQAFNPNQGSVRSVLKLFKGKIRALVSDYYHQAASEYRIETPTAVSGVRGTDFIVLYDEEGAYSDVVGVTGRVEVHSILNRKGGGVFVTTQELTRIETGRPPSPVRLLDQPTFLRYLEGLKFISGGRPDGLMRDNAVASGSEVPAPMQAVTVIQMTEGATAAASAVAAVEAASAKAGSVEGSLASASPALVDPIQTGPPRSVNNFSHPPDGTTQGFHDVGVFPQPPAILNGVLSGKGDIGVRF